MSDFGDRDLERIARTVRRVERQSISEPSLSTETVSRVAQVELIRVTSATADHTTNGYKFFPAMVQQCKPSDMTFTDVDDCWAVGILGDDLGINVGIGGVNAAKFLARRIGDDSGRPCFMACQVGSVSVFAADGSPSFSDVTELDFDEVDGFTISEPGAAGILQLNYRQTYRCGTLSATGTTQGTAAAIAVDSVRATPTAGNDGIILPATPAGARIVVQNLSATVALKVYPPVGGQIAALGANVAKTVGVSLVFEFASVISTNLQWWTAALT